MKIYAMIKNRKIQGQGGLKKTFLFCYMLGLSVLLPAQSRHSQEFAASFLSNSISSERLKAGVYALAHDSMQGREFGSEGEMKAARWIAAQLQQYQVDPLPGLGSYFQQVIYRVYNWEELFFQSGAGQFEANQDFCAYPGSVRPMAISGSEIIYLGYGLELPEYNEYAGIDVKGQVVMIHSGVPMTRDSVNWLTGKKWIPGSEESIQARVRRAAAKGAMAVLVIDPDLKDRLRRDRSQLYEPVRLPGSGHGADFLDCNYMVISTGMAEAIAADRLSKLKEHNTQIQKRGRPMFTRLYSAFEWHMKTSMSQQQGVNVIGYVEGSDLGREAVVLSAHYDHLGTRNYEVYNGADDNASGTNAVLEIMANLAQAKKQGYGLRRSVVAILFTGEEKRLLGSQYYVEYPAWPLEQTVADLNIDMVGRSDKKHEDQPDYIYVIGADRLSSELGKIQVETNDRYSHLLLDYTYNAKDDPNRFYYRSDHYNFARRGIPSVFYFSGTHADYHKAGDDADKLNYELLTRRTRFFFLVLWDIANRNARLPVDQRE